MGNLSAVLAKNSLLKQSRTNGAAALRREMKKLQRQIFITWTSRGAEEGEEKYNLGKKKEFPATRPPVINRKYGRNSRRGWYHDQRKDRHFEAYFRV